MEKIIVNIMELEMITKDKDANYFYDSFEMPILCSLIDNIDKNLNIITPIIKRKYCNINWDIINSKKEQDGELKTLKIGKVWELANGVLKKELYNNVKNILELELPAYYKMYCYKQHEKAIKSKKVINLKD